MSRVNLSVALLLYILAAGCVGSRDNLAATAAPAPATAATAQAAPIQQAPTAQPTTVVDGNQLAQREAVTCREILQRGSNVHVRQCMTATAWKRWERAEAREAEATVRALQGSRYH